MVLTITGLFFFCFQSAKIVPCSEGKESRCFLFVEESDILMRPGVNVT